jgi:hypothetical protein
MFKHRFPLFAATLFAVTLGITASGSHNLYASAEDTESSVISEHPFDVVETDSSVADDGY